MHTSFPSDSFIGLNPSFQRIQVGDLRHMRLLVVEDEPRLATLLRRGLTEEGHAVDLSGTGEEALEWTDTATFDAIVLDVMLPQIDGLEVCRRLRKRRIHTPV